MNNANEIRDYVDYIIKLSNHPLDLPLDYQLICQALNLKLGFFDKETLPENLKSVRGILDYKNRKILIKEDDYKPRMLFTFAHEIGHFVIPDHIEHFSGCQKICNENDINYSTDNYYEIEANKFAADLLFKGSNIENLYKENETVDFNLIDDISEKYGVSREATARHLILNSPSPQIIFFYDNLDPFKHPSVNCSYTVGNDLGMQVFKANFAKEMREIEEEHFEIEKQLFNKYDIKVSISYRDNDYKKIYIMTVDKITPI